nr:hypothetical protein [Tatlockia sp.]
MREILYDANCISSKEELDKYKELIVRLQCGELKFPKIKMLKGISYHGMPTYRVKTDKKERLIYTYITYLEVKTLCILAINDHNYPRLKRQLKSTNLGQINLLDLQEEDSNLIQDYPEKSLQPIKFLPAVPHKKTMVAWDEQQHLCHLSKGAIIFSGPPGAGKTLVLYNNMLRNIYAQPELGLQQPILFISHSPRLLNTLREDYQNLGLEIPVKFVTWLDFIASSYPKKKTVTEEHFKTWLTKMKWQDDMHEVYYELSLIIALGEEVYLKLGKRQCHFAEDKPKQQKLIYLLKCWQSYLEKNDFFDPMVSRYTNEKESFAAIYSDETQNLPPAALAFLIELGDKYIASLDSEQCLLFSPYIHNCLKLLLYKQYQFYGEIQLAKTWRCPPEIIAVGNHLMDAKYRIDGSGNRREYKEVESTLPKGSGLISWVDTQNLAKLKNLCSSAGTVVIVEYVTEELRAIIQQTLGTNNILTSKDVIGLEFDNVILWEPLSQRKCFSELAQRKQLQNSSLSLEQWNAINAIYVSITRAQKVAYLYDDKARKRLNSLPEILLGELPLNQFNHTDSMDESKNQWQILANKYLEEGQIENAKEIKRFHLPETQLDIEPSLPQEAQSTTTTDKSKINPIPTITNNNKRKASTPEKRQGELKPPNTLTVEQRKIDAILSNFNQNTLMNLFKQQEGMRLLFEIPTGNHFCLFSRCISEQNKYITFKKFIKENGKIAAEKLTPQRLIEAKIGYRIPTSEKYGHKKELITLISYLYQHKYESILHWLLKKYSPAQRIHFICDSLIYSAVNAPIMHDEQILSLINFNEKTLADNRKELVDLLCQPMRYVPSAPYIYHLCSSTLGISLIAKLISNQTLFKSICENLYTVPQNLESSIFHRLSINEVGVEVLNKIYDLDPSLTKKISIDDLLAKKPKKNPSSFHSLSKLVFNGGHLVLKRLITPDIAAKMPHGLPNIFNLFFLCCAQDGVEIIKLMMDNQIDMVAKMTGKVICKWPNSDRMSILGLLSLNEGGPAILNCLLDFHGKKLVKQLTDHALFYPLIQNDHRDAYEFLKGTEEG